jgi:CRISPR-associated protein Cas5h
MTQANSTNSRSERGTRPEGSFIPDTCIGFDIAADYAHFRRVGTNSAKPSYRIPPRTTVSGLLAGIMGLPRDSYYDIFSPETSAITVVPKEMPHTYTMGITTVNTKADDAIQYRPKEQHYTKAAEMLTPESYIKYDRQRDTYEMLVDPVYRVYVALSDKEIHEELFTRLNKPEYHYSPSLGLSECLAEITSVDTYSVNSETTDEIDSAVYDDTAVIPTPGVSIKRERAPLYMERTEGGRRTTAFGNLTYVTNDAALPIDETRPCKVGTHSVIFH